ncbi:hypothetical protein DFH28DRAFT_897164 [Melampsora americana]|nr:hypothetical protein DFH28DRAFT_897164 [Melampsora americana]
MANLNRIIQSIKSNRHSSSQNNLSSSSSINNHNNKRLKNSSSHQTLPNTIVNHSIPVLSLDIPSGQLLPNQSNRFNPNTSAQDEEHTIGEDVDVDSSSLLSLQSDRPTSPWVDLGHRVSTLDSASHFLISGSSLSPAGHRRCQYVHFGPTQLTELIRLCSPMILSRGLDTLGLFRPWRTSERPLHIGRLQLLFINYLLPSPPSTSEADEVHPSLTAPRSVRVEDVQDELVFTLVHDLIHVLKWAIRHLSYQSTRFALQPSWYEEFCREEREKAYPQNAYTSILLPLLPYTTQDLLNSILELVAAVAAHVDQNAMPAAQLCRYLGFWILGRGTDSFVSFDHLYLEWERSGRAFEHIFLAYLRSQARLPKRLRELVSVYPLEPSNLVFTPRFTTKVIKVLKVQVTSCASPVQEPIQPQQEENVNSSIRSSSLRRPARTPSLRQGARTPSFRQVGRSYSRSRRSVSIATSTPVSNPLSQVPQSRGPLDIIKAANEAVLSDDHDGELLTDSPSYRIWQTVLEKAKSSDPRPLPLTDNVITASQSEPLVSLLDNETQRVMQITRAQAASQPVNYEATPNSPPEPLSASSKGSTVGRPRSFSLDVSPIHPHQPLPLTTLYEHSCSSRVLLSTKPEIPRPNTISQASAASSPPAPTTSWADFVASGFSSSSQHLETKLTAPEPIELPQPRTSMSTVRSAATTVNQYKRRTINRHRRSKFPAPSVRSFKPEDQPAPLIDTPPPPPPPIAPLLRSVTVVNVDEAFPDLWLDTLGEPMIRSQWPNFVFSQLKKEIQTVEKNEIITHLLIDELTMDRKPIGRTDSTLQFDTTVIHSVSPPTDLEELGLMTQSRSHSPNPNPASSLPPNVSVPAPVTHQPITITSVFCNLGKQSKRWFSSLFDDQPPRLGSWVNKHKRNKSSNVSK